MGVVGNNPLLELQNLLARVQAGSKEVMNEWGDEVVQEQKLRVPVRTGNLRDNIKKIKSKNGVGFRIDTKKAPYAYSVEFGRSDRKYKRTPFFFAPIEEKQPVLEDKLMSRLSKEVSRD